MRSNKKAVFGLMLGAVWVVASGALPAQQLVYEREYSMFESGSRVLLMTLDPDGSLRVERPAMMTHSGSHRATVPVAHYQQLSAALDAIQADSRSLKEDLRERARVELFHVSDVETSRFARLDARRAAVTRIEIESLQPMAERFDDDVRLRALLDLEQHWWQLMKQVIAVDGGGQ
ncbi:MAG: hypothetical protein LC637_12250 [Xanthomonadaceae bacterium]|nr:hypothetical protein [Xanthomonadaceae bacterium]